MTMGGVWQGTVRECVPPVRVRVDLVVALPPSRVGVGAVPLRVRAAGLALDPVDGVLLSWHRTAAGDWLGLVEMTLTNRTGGALPVVQLVPKSALRPADFEVDEIGRDSGCAW